MKPIRDVRRERLAALVADNGGQSTVAAKLGKDKNQVYQWLLPADNKASRNISDTTARAIEQAFGLPAGWMDQALADESGSADSPDAAAGLTEQASQSEQLDDDKLARSVWFLQRQFESWDREFDPGKNIDLIAGVYARIGKGAPDNLIRVSRWLLEKIEDGERFDVGERRAGKS